MGEQRYVCAMKDSDAFVVASTLDVYYVMSIIGKDILNGQKSRSGYM